MQIKLEVRCCCNPVKLLGWLHIDSRMLEHNSFILTAVGPLMAYEPIAELSTKRFMVQLSDFSFGTRTYRAVKSMDLPVDVWRQFPQFEPNPEYQEN